MKNNKGKYSLKDLVHIVPIAKHVAALVLISYLSAQAFKAFKVNPLTP